MHQTILPFALEDDLTYNTKGVEEVWCNKHSVLNER